MNTSNTSLSPLGDRHPTIRSLTYIGLIGLGLLAGILVMLIANPVPPRSQLAEIRLVERSEADQETTDMELSPPTTVGGSTFRNVAHSAVQSVVSISVQFGWHAHLWASLDMDEGRDSEGSGVVITPQGHILTNYHLIENAGKLNVLFADKREYEAYTVGVDRSADLAVIQIVLGPGESVKSMTIGDSETLQLGDWVLAIGNPLQLNSTVTAGIVSGKGRSMNIIDTDFGVEDFIQTDAAINPGNSGGALVNLQGELIGINTAIATNSGYFEGYGFAIPVNLAIRVASDLIEFGEFRRSYMGVMQTDIDAKLARALGMTSVQGVFLDQVYEGGAAEIAGLRPGDVIYEVDGRPIDKANQLQSTVLLKPPYSKIEVGYWRDGQINSTELTLLGQDHPHVASWLMEMGYRPDPEVLQARYLDEWGLVIRDKSEEDEAQYGTLEGIIIQRVIRQDEIANLQEGMLIKRINGRSIHSVKEAIKELRSAGETVRFSLEDKWSTQHMVSLSALK
ncbi:MAG: trypsin-like peptidase domain-containing protein [Bacteroidetes bacterium]|nr:trypsin-like peptidase domain-containing protein [Bacteroidota bacterium]MCY4205772.1 trypsin-like peptidase domain-containing protein [Bacteroidota bacterium]